MAKIKQAAFAAINVRESGKPHICSWTVAGMARSVRDAVGRAWCEEDPKSGWEAAKLDGMKVIKIEMVALTKR